MNMTALLQYRDVYYLHRCITLIFCHRSPPLPVAASCHSQLCWMCLCCAAVRTSAPVPLWLRCCLSAPPQSLPVWLCAHLQAALFPVPRCADTIHCEYNAHGGQQQQQEPSFSLSCLIKTAFQSSSCPYLYYWCLTFSGFFTLGNHNNLWNNKLFIVQICYFNASMEILIMVTYANRC